MIVVIADDITGAAEIAGIGLRNNLEVEMSMVINKDCSPELLVVATDTRSVSEEEAKIEIEKVTREVLSLNPELIYKKIDSVLRGYVIAEIETQLKVLKKRKALIVAANPSLGRTIGNGTYFYNGKPIHTSSFSNDPEFAIKTSDVLGMLRTDAEKVKVVKLPADISGEGIFVGEVAGSEDVRTWADVIDENILPAGGADFFSAILQAKNIKHDKQLRPGSCLHEPALSSNYKTGSAALFVCGSTFHKSRELIKAAKNNNGPVSYMPLEIINSSQFEEEYYRSLCDEIVSLLHSNGAVIIAIDPDVLVENNTAAMLREKTAVVVKRVFDTAPITDLFIEGGSTAASIIKKLNFEKFIPVEELARGVVTMRVAEKKNLFITVKPGSYDWPERVWKF